MAVKKKKRRGFSLKSEYKKSLDYIRESKNFIFLAAGIFFVFALIGFFLPAPDYISQEVGKYIRELVLQTSGMSGVQLASFIFFNNLKSSFLGMALGLLLGVFPVAAAIFNGYLLGFVASGSVKTDGVLILLRLLPYGIFELFAAFISLGVGIRLGLIIFRKKESMKVNLIGALRIFLLVVIPLLIIAAIIEGSLISLLR